ncbi:hypothetical protein NCS52_00455800 [Fusarium sp. LHS14.1]|nr:hypothetical protein NCS52_00455800 [Fusarium sp. LHS14.1]
MAKLKAEKMAEAAAQKAERLAQDVEKIAKKVAKDAEELVKNKSRLRFCSLHGHSDNHDGRGPAPASTYHHYHHGQITATETSTTTVTSTTVATSITTITCTAVISSTTATASVTPPTLNAAATPTVEEFFGHMATARVWVLALFLLINAAVVTYLVDLGELKAKSSTRSKQLATSPSNTKRNLACLESCITTRLRQIFATILCRIVIGLYLLEAYQAMDAVLGMFWAQYGLSLTVSASAPWIASLLALLAIMSLVGSVGLLGFLFYLALDQQFTLDGVLSLLPVHVDVSSGPVHDDGEKSRHDSNGARGQVETDEKSAESDSEGDWEKDGF